MIIIKKFILIFIVFLLCGCSIDKPTHNYVDDENYIKLVNMLNEPVMDDSMLKYKTTLENLTDISSYNYSSNYLLKFAYNHKQYSHSINTNTIEVKDILTNTTTTFKDNVNIESLDNFSTIVLDSYKEEFSYYSMKDFIPLALSLTEDTNLDFFHELEQFDKNTYRLTGTIEEFKLDDKLHDIFINTSNDYKELYNKENNKITIIFRTNEDNSYFLSSFVFKINDKIIAQIS